MALLGSCNPAGLPAWSREGAIGDYGGSTTKMASEGEGETPYSFAVYQSLKAQRGSAYTSNTGTLVHCENLALARTLAAVWYRTPEKLRANMTPALSDERLDYWAGVLGIPVGPRDQRWQVRQLAAAHYQATKGATFDNVSDAVSALLGDAFVQLDVQVGTDLATPPSVTFWPGINPGPAGYNLGGGTWLSERCHLVVIVTQPSGMSDAAFSELVGQQLFQLLDRMMPAWATFNWAFSSGFLLDVSSFDYDGL